MTEALESGGNTATELVSEFGLQPNLRKAPSKRKKGLVHLIGVMWLKILSNRRHFIVTKLAILKGHKTGTWDLGLHKTGTSQSWDFPTNSSRYHSFQWTLN
jgi:hypothetical protein